MATRSLPTETKLKPLIHETEKPGGSLQIVRAHFAEPIKSESSSGSSLQRARAQFSEPANDGNGTEPPVSSLQRARAHFAEPVDISVNESLNSLQRAREQFSEVDEEAEGGEQGETTAEKEWIELDRPVTLTFMADPGVVEADEGVISVTCDQRVDTQTDVCGTKTWQVERGAGHHDNKRGGACKMMDMRKGPHITLISILSIPFALVGAVCVVFYYGSMTWYNLYIYLSEERSIWHQIFICPVLILTFPFTIGFLCLGLGVYSALVQISWFFHAWIKEIKDPEKGFWGWLCCRLTVPQCAPYKVVFRQGSAELQALPTRVPV